MRGVSPITEWCVGKAVLFARAVTGPFSVTFLPYMDLQLYVLLQFLMWSDTSVVPTFF